MRLYLHCISQSPKGYCCCCCSSVTKLCPTLGDPMDYSTRLPCPSPSPGVCSSSCPLSPWCYPTISSSVTLFSSCLQSFSASGSFPSESFWLFALGGQSIGASASASVFPMNTRGLFPLGLTKGLLSQGVWSPFSQGTLKSILQHHNSKASILWRSAFFMVHLSHSYVTTGETTALILGTLLAKWCLCFLICCLGLS